MIDDRELLFKQAEQGVDELVDSLLSDACPEELQETYRSAHRLRKSGLKRTYVESCLLASSDFAKISELLEIPERVIEIYALMFYDIQGCSILDKMELLDVPDKQERLMKLWALNQGLDFVQWRLGKKTLPDSVAGLQDLFSTSLYKAKEAAFSGNETEASKEALKWTKMSADLARLIRTYSSGETSARHDIEIALQDLMPEFQGLAEIEGWSGITK